MNHSCHRSSGFLVNIEANKENTKLISIKYEIPTVTDQRNIINKTVKQTIGSVTLSINKSNIQLPWSFVHIKSWCFHICLFCEQKLGQQKWGATLCIKKKYQGLHKSFNTNEEIGNTK